MKTKRVFGIVAIISLVAVVSPAQDLKREQDLSQKEGKPAPALKADGWINTPNGKPLDLESLRGKVVVIDFWGTW